MMICDWKPACLMTEYMSNKMLILAAIWGCIFFHQAMSNTDYQLSDTPFANKEFYPLDNYFYSDFYEPLVRPKIWIKVTFIVAKELTWCVGFMLDFFMGVYGEIKIQVPQKQAQRPPLMSLETALDCLFIFFSQTKYKTFLMITTRKTCIYNLEALFVSSFPSSLPSLLPLPEKWWSFGTFNLIISASVSVL